MATQLPKNPSQAKPAADTWVDVYRVEPPAQGAVLAVIIAPGATDGTFDLGISIDGDAGDPLGDGEYWYEAEPIIANRSFAVTIGMTAESDAIVRFRNTTGLMHINIFKVERQP